MIIKSRGHSRGIVLVTAGPARTRDGSPEKNSAGGGGGGRRRSGLSLTVLAVLFLLLHSSTTPVCPDRPRTRESIAVGVCRVFPSAYQGGEGLCPGTSRWNLSFFRPLMGHSPSAASRRSLYLIALRRSSSRPAFAENSLADPEGPASGDERWGGEWADADSGGRVISSHSLPDGPVGHHTRRLKEVQAVRLKQYIRGQEVLAGSDGRREPRVPNSPIPDRFSSSAIQLPTLNSSKTPPRVPFAHFLRMREDLRTLRKSPSRQTLTSDAPPAAEVLEEIKARALPPDTLRMNRRRGAGGGSAYRPDRERRREAERRARDAARDDRYLMVRTVAESRPEEADFHAALERHKRMTPKSAKTIENERAKKSLTEIRRSLRVRDRRAGRSPLEGKYVDFADVVAPYDVSFARTLKNASRMYKPKSVIIPIPL